MAPGGRPAGRDTSRSLSALRPFDADANRASRQAFRVQHSAFNIPLPLIPAGRSRRTSGIPAGRSRRTSGLPAGRSRRTSGLPAGGRRPPASLRGGMVPSPAEWERKTGRFWEIPSCLGRRTTGPAWWSRADRHGVLKYARNCRRVGGGFRWRGAPGPMKQEKSNHVGGSL